jgi:hypothetical protein
MTTKPTWTYFIYATLTGGTGNTVVNSPTPISSAEDVRAVEAHLRNTGFDNPVLANFILLSGPGEG